MKKHGKSSKLKIDQDIQQKTDILGAIFQIGAVFIGVYALIVIFADGIELEYEKELVITAVVAATVLYTLVFLFPEFLKYTIPVILLITGILIWKKRAYIIDGFYHIENTVIYLINNYFNTRWLRYVTEYDKKLSITAVLVSLVQLLSIIVSIAVYYGIWKQAAYILSILILSLIYALGKNPPELQLMLLAVFLIYIAVSSFVPIQELTKVSAKSNINLRLMIYSQRRRTHSGIYASIIFFMLAITVFLLYPSSRHKALEENRNEAADSIRIKIESIDLQSAWNNLSDTFIDTFFSDKKRIINITRDSGTIYNGGVSGGKLGKAGEISFTNETALKLTLPKDSDVVYLKGYVGTNYTGDAWESLDDESEEIYKELLQKYNNKYYAQNQLSSYYQRLIKYPIMTADIDMYKQAVDSKLNKVKEYKMVIDYVNADDKYVYVPYTVSEIKPNIVSRVSDSYYEPSPSSKLYYYTYYDLSIDEMLGAAGYYRLRDSQIGLGIEKETEDETEEKPDELIKETEAFEDYLSYMDDYNQYVMDTYLDVPEGLDDLKMMAQMLMSPYVASSTLRTSKYDYRLYMISLVEDLLKTYMYTLSPGKVPDGRDYVEYFLMDNRKGYCVHFATAATLLLRSMGVPARYVEGYIVTRKDIVVGIVSGREEVTEYTFITEDGYTVPFENMSQDLITIEIRDTNAHAWVEVYFDDYGWIPIEATKGYSTSGYSINPEIQSNIVDIPEPTKLPTNTPTPTPRDYDNQGLTQDEYEEEMEDDSRPFLPNKNNKNGNGTSGGLDDEQRGLFKLINMYKNLNPIIKRFINIVLLALLIAAVIVIRYTLLKMKIKSRITKGSRKRKIIWLYYEMERLYKWLYIKKMDDQSYMEFAEDVTKYGQAPRNFERVMEIVLRSRFSNDIVTEEEFTEVYECYSYFRNTIYNRSGDKKKKWIRYIVVI